MFWRHALVSLIVYVSPPHKNSIGTFYKKIQQVTTTIATYGKWLKAGKILVSMHNIAFSFQITFAIMKPAESHLDILVFFFGLQSVCLIAPLLLSLYAFMLYLSLYLSSQCQHFHLFFIILLSHKNPTFCYFRCTCVLHAIQILIYTWNVSTVVRSFNEYMRHIETDRVLFCFVCSFFVVGLFVSFVVLHANVPLSLRLLFWYICYPYISCISIYTLQHYQSTKS